MEVSQKWSSLNINLESPGPGETKVENGLHGGDCRLICHSAGMRLLSKGLGLQEASISLSKRRDVESYTPICLEDSFDSSLFPSQALYGGNGKTVSFGGFVDVLVVMAAVPQIKEVVPQADPVVLFESDSESEYGYNDSQAEEE
ncbi:hypothetical protein Bca4012_097718 [Brassica carinata]